MKMITDRRVMRTPVLLVAGQGDADSVAGTLLRGPGTLVVEHRFDGHVVKRTVRNLQDGALVTAETALELAHGCIACTIRDDLLILLRKLHRRADVERIVVHLSPWLEPEPTCWAINYVRVSVGQAEFADVVVLTAPELETPTTAGRGATAALRWPCRTGGVQ